MIGIQHKPPLRVEVASNPSEVETARRLFQQYAAELGVDLCFQGFAEELRTLPGLYAPPEGRLLLGWLGDQAVGCVGLRPRSADMCEMKRLFLQPSFRNAGFGRTLADRVVAEARSIGYRCMVLDTLASMKSALTLYHSLGFRPCPAYYPNPLPDVVYLELPLDCVERLTSY